MLAPGRYTIRIVNDRFKFRNDISLEIKPGKLTSHTVSLPTAGIRVNTTPGADVWVEGEHIGSAPLGELHVPIGTREVMVRHGEMGERRQSVEVIYGQTTELTLGFGFDPVSAGIPRLAPLSAPPAPRP
jgi:hypothetical protein